MVNWPSYWEDIQERAAASPPPNRQKLSLKAAADAQQVDFGGNGPGPSFRPPRPSAADREAALYIERMLDARDRRIEAQTRAYATDLRAWQFEVSNVEPLRRR
jgi:hypothetical protein